jgi:L-ascorbate metabolism protein UlaG (beta-lactamase superfamily)
MTPLGHIGAGLAYLATARRQQASDHVTARQCAWPANEPLAKGLAVTWFGTAGFRFAYQGVTLWIDPYVSRIAMADFVRRRATGSSPDCVARWIDKADAILVGHTHFDHALDVPAIARATGAAAYGSRSLQHLMSLHGQSSTVVESHRDYEVGPFRFHFVPSRHSKLQLGLGIPYSGELTSDRVDDLSPQAYKCGQVWGICVEVAGTRFYHQGSADLIEDEIRDRDVDFFLCGISGRRFTDDYAARIIRRLSPKVIVPTHYDDFFQPLGGTTKFSFNVNLTGFADEVHAATREPAIRTLEVGVPISG